MSDFNPHSRAGSDKPIELTIDTVVISIHTPVQGVTLSSHFVNVSGQHFNPHSRAGSDERFTKYVSDMMISIHTPVQGVT